MVSFCIGGVSFELCSTESIELAEFVSSMVEAREGMKTYETLAYDSVESRNLYRELRQTLQNNLDKSWYEEKFEIFSDECYRDYMRLSAIENLLYREYAEADFLEYASHKDEPNFDWGFYSDWHKDLYGFRPRH